MKQMTQVQSIPVLFIHLVILYYVVKLELSCSSCNFSERKIWLQLMLFVAINPGVVNR